MAVALTLLLTAVFMNKAPVATYFQAKAALNAEEQQVAEVQGQLDKLKEQTATLSDPSRLELEARKDLSYARPGEEMFIVKGLDDETNDATGNATGNAPAQTVTASGGQPEGQIEKGQLEEGQSANPGLLERMVRAICGAF